MTALAYRPENALNAICPYFTMFPLEYPLRVLRRHIAARPTVVDPFCGRGTTLFAARKLGLTARRLNGYDRARFSRPASLMLRQSDITLSNNFRSCRPLSRSVNDDKCCGLGPPPFGMPRFALGPADALGNCSYHEPICDVIASVQLRWKRISDTSKNYAPRYCETMRFLDYARFQHLRDRPRLNRLQHVKVACLGCGFRPGHIVRHIRGGVTRARIPGHPAVSGGELSAPGVGLFRILAAHRSPRHPAVRTRHRRGVAKFDAGFFSRTPYRPIIQEIPAGTHRCRQLRGIAPHGIAKNAVLTRFEVRSAKSLSRIATSATARRSKS